MTTIGWHGVDRLQTLWRDFRAQDDTDHREGLVIAGGGSRASFEIGALSYLYEYTPIEPDVIVGTSAGSIITATLAQYSTHDEQHAALQELEQVWRSLRTSDEMFAPRQWFAKLMAIAPDLQHAIPTALIDDDSDEEDVPTTVEERRAWFKMPDLEPFRSRWGSARPVVRKEPASHETEPDQHFHPLLGFGPENASDIAAEWTPSAVWQVVGALPGLSRATGEVPSIVKGAERTRAMYRPGTILRTLLSPEFFSPARISESGVTTRIAMVCLETGQLRYLDEKGQLRDRGDQPLPKPRQDFVMGLLASCSIPGVFAPVPIAGEHYVDGGVRENVAAEMAIGHLSAHEPWVIIANPPGLHPNLEAGSGSLIDIMFRVIDIFADECQRDEISYAQAAGGRVIFPEVDVHNTRTVDPGLIDINISYGWMRAQEIVLALGEDEIARHRELTMTRRRIWQLEDRLFNPALDGAPTEKELSDNWAELIAAKYVLRDLVRGATAPLPEGADSWWSGYEQHPFEISRPSNWVR